VYPELLGVPVAVTTSDEAMKVFDGTQSDKHRGPTRPVGLHHRHLGVELGGDQRRS